MTEFHERKQGNTAPWLFLVATIVLGLTGFGLFLLNRATPVPSSWATAGGPRDGLASLLNAFSQALITPGLAAVFGVLILAKQPAQRIGRLLIAVGLYIPYMLVVSEWAVYGAYTSPGSVPGTQLAAWTTNWIWIPLMALILLLVALFPSGDFLSRKWGWAFTIPLLIFLLPGVLDAALESPMNSAYQIPNPYFDSFDQSGHQFVFAFVNAALVIAAVTALAQMAARYRQSNGNERDQLKWLLGGVAVMAIMIIIGLLLTTDFGFRSASRADWVSELGAITVNSAILAPLLGVGIAMVRHQLYDIDFIIRRTTSYAIVTAVLALVYFGSVVILQRLFTEVTGQSSTVAIVLSTLLIAVLFLPLRRRVQDSIDRRFYRQKYDAEKVLNQFAATVRDETDLDSLTTELVRVIQETMQPEFVQLWLAPPGDPRQSHRLPEAGAPDYTTVRRSKDE